MSNEDHAGREVPTTALLATELLVECKKEQKTLSRAIQAYTQYGHRAPESTEWEAASCRVLIRCLEAVIANTKSSV